MQKVQIGRSTVKKRRLVPPRRPSARRMEAEIEWIRAYCGWDWWVTVTYAFDKTARHAARDLDEWLSNLAMLAGEHLTYAVAWDRQSRGRWHFHLLIHDPTGLLAEDSIRDGWWYGDVDVQEYDPDDAGAPAYMLVFHRDAQIDVACCDPQCRRRGGCRLGPKHRWFILFYEHAKLD